MEQFLGLPPSASAHGSEIDHSIVLIHILMLLLFLGWGTFYITLLVRFRKSKSPKANYIGNRSKFAIYLAAALGVFELGLLYTVDAPVWARRVAKLPDEKDALVVRVVAEQFSWNVHYPGRDGRFGRQSLSLVESENPLGLDRNDPDAKDDITTINQLNLPVNKPVIIYLTSKDVIHSFNLPLFRVKQDAIPGITVPVWFVPTRTTDQVREELKHTFSVADAMKKVKKITLPRMSSVGVRKGSSREDMISMQDYADSQGNTLISKGDKLTEENVGKLADAGVHDVSVRPSATLDKYVSMEEYKDSSGTMLAAKGDALSDDVITKLTTIGVKEVVARPASNMDAFVVMQGYTDKTGNAITQKGDPLSEDVVTKLADAGINEVLIAPATPTEIACAQLCGLGHYRMRGYVTVQSQEDFQNWYNQQEAALLPSVSQDSGVQAFSDSTSAH